MPEKEKPPAMPVDIYSFTPGFSRTAQWQLSRTKQ